MTRPAVPGLATGRIGAPAPPQRPGRRAPGKRGAPPRRGLPPLPRPRPMSLREMQGLLKQLPQHKPWMIAIGAIAVAVIVAVCSFGSFMLVKDDNEIVGAPPTPEASVVKRDITSRQTDPNPMTVADVFPNPEIVADPSYPPYKMMGKAQASNDCRVAADGEVQKRLQAIGCSQVVRATFSAPDGKYFVTGGIFNLPDANVASQFATDVRTLIADKQGRFTGYISDPAHNVVLGRARLTHAFEVRGHFLVYIVVVKVDGSEFAPDDPGVKVIQYDIMGQYLRDKVIADWSTEKTPLSASASP